MVSACKMIGNNSLTNTNVMCLEIKLQKFSQTLLTFIKIQLLNLLMIELIRNFS